MEKIDFITALGRLLRDGALRDDFFRDPVAVADSLNLAIAARDAVLALSPLELEAQAEVLLRKRFVAVTGLIPQTVANAGSHAWASFHDCARECWPEEPQQLEDAKRFCAALRATNPSWIAKAEANRLAFATGNQCARICFVPDAKVRNRRRWAVQVFARTFSRQWRELLLYPGL